MLDNKKMLEVIVISAFVVAFLWLTICAWLKATNFHKNGSRKVNKHDQEKPERRSEVIEYHNNAVYRAFEFYFKIALGIFGGMAYLTVSDKIVDRTASNALLSSGSWLLLAATFVFSSVITIHQKSKIERWQKPYKWWEPLLWIEFYLITGMTLVSIGVHFVVIPAIIK